MTEQICLPLRSWDEGMTLTSQKGSRLKRWGSVAKAGEMLWGYGKTSIYLLIEAEEIRAVKRGGAKNSHWRVDLMSVWEHKQRVEAGTRKRLEKEK